MIRFCKINPTYALIMLAFVPWVAAEPAADNATVPGGEQRIFDGSARQILYQTSSHGGQKQLQELLRMVPGGEKFTVLKMPYPWAKTPEKIREYPIIVARLGNHFNPPFKIKKLPISEKKFDEALAEFRTSVANRMKRDQPKIWIGINGHYHERDGKDEGAVLLATAAVHRKFQQENEDPRITVLDTITVNHQHHPLTVRSDHFHAGGVSGYLDAAMIVADLCRRDGIEMPKEIQKHVDKIVAEAADRRDAFVITAPTDITPDTIVKIGDKITCEWTLQDEQVKAVYVMLHRLGHDDYYLSGRIPVDSPEFGKLEWTAKNDLPVLGNRMTNIDKVAANAKPQPFKKKIPGGQKLFCFRIVDADRPDVFTFSPSFTIPFDRKN